MDYALMVFTFVLVYKEEWFICQLFSPHESNCTCTLHFLLCVFCFSSAQCNVVWLFLPHIRLSCTAALHLCLPYHTYRHTQASVASCVISITGSWYTHVEVNFLTLTCTSELRRFFFSAHPSLSSWGLLVHLAKPCLIGQFLSLETHKSVYIMYL